MSSKLQQAKYLLRRTCDWVRHDLPEIVFPSSLPDPPGYVAPPPTAPREWLQILVRAGRAYIDTWDAQKLEAKRRELRGEVDEPDHSSTGSDGNLKQDFKDLASEFAAAARGGTKAMKPFLLNLYQTRAAAYRDAVTQFIAGYKEGFQHANKPGIPPEIKQEMDAAGGGDPTSSSGGGDSGSTGMAGVADEPAAPGTQASRPQQQQQQQLQESCQQQQLQRVVQLEKQQRVQPDETFSSPNG